MAMAAALETLQKHGLRRDDVAAIHAGGEPGAEDNDVTDDEPLVTKRSELKEWRRWAAARAAVHANKVHPRVIQPDGRATLLSLRAPPNDLMQALGIVPCLYLDFLKFCGVYCALGLLCAIPSLVLSAMHAHEVYAPLTLAGYPTVFLHTAVGARTACTSDSCRLINLISAACEAVFSLLLLMGVIVFRRRAARMHRQNDANNVYTREYAVQLHGMPKDATAEDVRAHVQGVLKAHGGLSGADEHKVWDVALIGNSTGVLRQALRQAPLERRFAILDKKLHTLLRFKEERNTGWDINAKIIATRERAWKVGQDVLKVRERIAKRGFASASVVCGAFVTFEEQTAAAAMLGLYGGGLAWVRQRRELRMRGRRLRAFPAPQPRDVLHQNLPYRILALNARGMSTLLRRGVAMALLSACLLVSFAIIIAVNSLKNDAQQRILASPTLPTNLVSLVDMAFPTLASVVVVGVNVAIQALVGALGKFVRHPTLSAMHRNKASVIFLTQVQSRD